MGLSQAAKAMEDVVVRKTLKIDEQSARRERAEFEPELKAEIARLRSENAKLRDALEPCAALAPWFDGDPSDMVVYGCRQPDGSYRHLCVDDLRRARAVLSQTEERGEQ